MTRTQIQLPDPLYKKMKATAKNRDWSLAELVRRATESYLTTLPETKHSDEKPWQMPILRKSGGYRTDPSSVKAEAQAIEEKMKKHT